MAEKEFSKKSSTTTHEYLKNMSSLLLPSRARTNGRKILAALLFFSSFVDDASVRAFSLFENESGGHFDREELDEFVGSFFFFSSERGREENFPARGNRRDDLFHRQESERIRANFEVVRKTANGFVSAGRDAEFCSV